MFYEFRGNDVLKSYHLYCNILRIFLTVASVLNPSSVKKKMSICFSLLMTPILYLEMHRNPTIFENNEKPHVLFFFVHGSYYFLFNSVWS